MTSPRIVVPFLDLARAGRNREAARCLFRVLHGGDGALVTSDTSLVSGNLLEALRGTGLVVRRMRGGDFEIRVRPPNRYVHTGWDPWMVPGYTVGGKPCPFCLERLGQDQRP